MLFMRTILSLSLAAFALAFSVARPRSVDGHGGVGTSCLSQYALCTSLIDSTFVSGLIGRNNIYQGFQILVTEALGEIVQNGFFTQDCVNSLIGQIDDIAFSAITSLPAKGVSGLDDPTIDGYTQQIKDVVESALSCKVDEGHLDQGVVDNLLVNINELLVPTLRGPQ